MKEFDDRSKKRLVGVNADLVKVVTEALQTCPVNFVVTEGLRTLERQKQLLAAGASTTLRSRHLTGHAIDVAAFIDLDGTGSYTSGDNIRWDWPLYDTIAKSMKEAAAKVAVPIEWGGDWKSFKDGPHFQLPWDKYPA